MAGLGHDPCGRSAHHPAQPLTGSVLQIYTILFRFNVTVGVGNGAGKWAGSGLTSRPGLHFVVLHVIPEPQVPPLSRRMALLSY